MDLKSHYEIKILEIIQQWEQNNDPSNLLNFDNSCLFNSYTELPGILLEVPYLPNYVTHVIDSINIKLPNILPQSIQKLSLSSYYPLKSMPILPDSLVSLRLDGKFDQPLGNLILPNSLRTLIYKIHNDYMFPNLEIPNIPQFPSRLEFLELGCSFADGTIPPLPQTLKHLIINHTWLNTLPELPPSLETLDVCYNGLTKLPKLPSSLRKLLACTNCLIELPELPESLRELRVSDNKLRKLPELPSNLEILSIDTNKIDQLPTIPLSLRSLCCYNNRFQSTPEVPNPECEVIS